MEDVTPHATGMPVYDLLAAIEAAIEASGRFSEENAIGDYRAMTLFVSDTDGPELAVTVAIPEHLGR